LDHPQRFIYLALVIAWSIFRIIRYARAATAKRPAPATPPSVGALPPSMQPTATARTATRSPIEPVRTGGGLTGKLAALGILIGGNLLIWPLLFLLPALEEVPPLLRLMAGVLANFFLLQAGRSVAARIGGSSGAADDHNPIR
jgi:hypothetical protein